MRQTIRGLTGRGRGLVAVGVGLLLGAIVFGQRDLLQVAVLILALPVLSVLVVARGRYRLACARSVTPHRIPVGGTAEVTVVLENVSRLPSGLLLVEDALPWELGPQPRFVLDRVEPTGTREVDYAVASLVRGRYTVGPVSVRMVDPFGLVAMTRAFTARDTLLVTPVVHPLPAAPLGGDWSGQGDSRPRSIASSGEDDVVPRDYRTGDDLRRVHWRATARYGDLMVRREEQPWRSRATVLVDTRASAHRGTGPESSFEWALSAAASVCVHLARRGWSLRLVDGDGVPLVADSAEAGADTEGQVLDALAVAAPSESTRLGAADPQARRQTADGVVVAVLGALDTATAESLARVKPGGGTAIALIQDVGAWRPHAGPSRDADHAGSVAAAALLRQAGWRVVLAGPGDPLGTLWPQAVRGVGAIGPTTVGSAGRAVRTPTAAPTPGTGGAA